MSLQKHHILITWTICILISLPLTLQAESEEGSEEELPQNYFLKINPGFIVSSTTIDITGKGGQAEMVNRGSGGIIDWMLDMKTSDLKLSENWGVHFLLHTRSFDLKYQQYQTERISSGESGESGSTTVREDLGTRLQGYYALTVPVLYYDFDGQDGGGSFGLGYGPSLVEMTGNVSINNSIGNIPLIVSNTREQLAANLQLSTLALGSINFTQGDLIYNALLLGLTQPGGLERMGAYLIARGDIRPSIPTLFLVNYLTGPTVPGNRQLNLLEAIATTALINVNVNFRENYAPAFFLFLQYEAPAVTFRLAYGGPQFSRDGFRYNFSSIIVSLSVPIRI